MLHIETATTANTDYSAATPFVFQSPTDDEQLFGIISAEGEAVVSVLKEQLLVLQENYFEDSRSAPEKLQQSVEFFLKQEDTLEQKKILMGGAKSGNVYLYSNGDIKAYLLLEDRVILLNKEQGLVSGHLESGSLIYLLTDSLEKLLDKQGGISFQEISPENLQEDLERLIFEHNTTHPLAALLIYPEQIKESSEVVLPDIAPHANPRLRVSIRDRISNIMPRSIRGKIYLGLSLILLVLFTVFLIHKSSVERAQQREVLRYLKSSKEALAAAQTLKDINQEESRLALNSAQEAVNKAKIIAPKNQEVLSLAKELAERSKDILRVYEVTEPPLFLSLDLIRKNLSTNSLSMYGDQILFFDTNNKAVVLLSLINKSNQIVTGEEKIGAITDCALGPDRVLCITDRGVVTTDLKQKRAETVISKDKSWGILEKIVSFGGNIYLLDPIRNAVWKHLATGNGYSEAQNYFKGSPSLHNGKKLLIDGSVWVLQNGALYKFTQGVADGFAVRNLDVPLENIANFFVSDDSENVYLYDQDHKRVVVTKKNGEYLYQLVGAGFMDLNDLVVLEKSKKLYLLKENRLYEVSLP
jgi:hypothetical protein